MSKRQQVEVADILRYSVAEGELKACKEQWKVVNALTRCRTASLGGHLYRCSKCSHQQPHYNSCRNRHCPKRQGADISKWLEKRSEDLLPVPYFHTVFTVPHELNPVFLQNKPLMYDLLFKAVNKTLLEATKTRYQGKPGYFAILHTWGQKLEFHPHIHCVIPGVVVTEGGDVTVAPDNYFIPDRILNKIFKGVFLKLLGELEVKKKLVFHGEAALFNSPKVFKNLKHKIASKDWIVYSKKPFSGPQAALKYLARYTHRVAISNSRLKTLRQGQVIFNYKDYSNNRQHRTCSLSATEFSRRFLLHTLPRHFVRIRHYGFLANSNKAEALTKIRKELKAVAPTSSITEIIQNIPCPACKKGILEKATPLILLTFPENRPLFPHRTHPPPNIRAQSR